MSFEHQQPYSSSNEGRACTGTITIVCHDFIDNIDRRILNYAADQIRLGKHLTILGITREHKTVDKVVSPKLRIVGAPVLEIKYDSPKWLKGAYAFSIISWTSIVSYYVLKRRALGMYLEKRSPKTRLVLLAIRRKFKLAVAHLINATEKVKRRKTETLSEFARAKTIAKSRELRSDEIAHLKRLASGSNSLLPLGRLAPEEFDPLPFNELFDKYLAKLDTPDLLIACDLPALPAAVKYRQTRGCKLIYDAHELYPFQKEFTRRQKLYLAQEEAISLRSVDHVITVSDSIVDYFQQIYGVQATCVNNAPSFETLPDTLGEIVKLPTNEGQITLLYHGGFSRGRQLLELAQAFKKMNRADVAIIYIGAGELRPDLEKLASTTPNFYILDSIPQEAIPALLRSVDLITISYPALDENTRGAFPNKLGDAIQLGVPIIGNSEMENLAKICGLYGIGFCGKMNDIDAICDTLEKGVNWYKSLTKSDLAQYFDKARADLGWESQIIKFDRVVRNLIDEVAPGNTPTRISITSQDQSR